MLIKYYRNYSTFRKIFNVLAVSLLGSIIVLAFILSIVFTNALTRETNDISTRMLSRLTLIVNQTFNDAQSVMLSLGYGQNIDLNGMMFGSEPNRLVDYNGHTRMRLLQTIYPGISYIGVYNGVQNNLSCTIGLDDDTKERLRLAILQNYDQQNAQHTIPMTNYKIVTKGNDPEIKTLTLIYYSPLSAKNRIGAIFTAIDCKYLGKFIASINKEDNQITFLVDGDGTVLSHPDDTQIFQSYKDVPYIQKALSSEKANGYYVENIDHKKILVTYLRNESLGWTYFTLTGYEKMTRTLRSVNLIIISISLLILLVGALIAIRSARNTFHPIATLLDRTGYQPSFQHTNAQEKKAPTDIGYLNDQIENYLKTIHTEESLLLNHAYVALLNGNLDSENTAQIRKHEENLIAPFYTLCLLQLAGSQHYKDLSKKERQYLRIELARTVDDCLKPLTLGTTPVFMSSETMVIILHMSSCESSDGIALGLMEAQKQFYDAVHLQFSAALSSSCNDLFSLQEAYEEAQQRMTEHFFAEEEAIFQDIRRKITITGYDSKQEHEIWTAILAGDDERMKSTLHLFITDLNTLSYEYAIHYINRLALNLIAFSFAQTKSDQVDTFSQYESNLYRFRNLQEAYDGLLALSRLSMSLLRKNEDYVSSEKIDRAMTAVPQRYMDPGFSTNTAAQDVGLSISYFNRQFRAQTGKSFSAYLNSHRLNMAGELLRTTSMPMNKICEDVGIANESYFYSLFKNEFGVTPHQYRSTHRQEET